MNARADRWRCSKRRLVGPILALAVFLLVFALLGHFVEVRPRLVWSVPDKRDVIGFCPSSVFSPDGKWLVTDNCNETGICGPIRIWNTRTGEEYAHWLEAEDVLPRGLPFGHDAIDFTSDGQKLLVVVGQDDFFSHETMLRIYDIAKRG